MYFPVGMVHMWVWRIVLRSPLPSTEPKTPKTRKVSKKSPERSLGTPRPRTAKSQKKVRKVKKIVDWQTFFWLFGHFWDFFGVRGRGVPNSARETFLRLFGVFAVFGSVDGRGDLNPKIIAKTFAFPWRRISRDFEGTLATKEILGKGGIFRRIAHEMRDFAQKRLF